MSQHGLTASRAERVVLWGLLLLALSQCTGCVSTRTASGDVTNESQEMELKGGDEIRVITSRRERFKLIITEVQKAGLAGRTVSWGASDVAPNEKIFLCYRDIAFIQIDTPSPLATVGLVASVTVLGGLIAAIAASPAPVMMP
jgi:hypothetical protein